MADTNFAAQASVEKTLWAKQLWHEARNNSFMSQFTGSDSNAIIQRITELKKDEKGARAVITLVSDLVGDGVAGDSTLESNEEAGQSSDCVIRLDMLRHAMRSEGRMAEQKSVVNFRNIAKDRLAYWLADRCDQLAFLTMSGIGYNLTNKGAPRAGTAFADLEFSADVNAPTSNRHLMWDGTDLAQGNTGAAFDSAAPLSYRSLVWAKAHAKETYMHGVKGKGGNEFFHVFVNPTAMAHLKLDADYLKNVQHAWTRGEKNPLFAGTSSVMVDGLVIHEFRHVFSTTGAADGNKWGTSGDIDGVRVLMCGSQALAFADIGDAIWDERDHYDYGNKPGISAGKIMGFLKPQLDSIYTGQTEDFNILTIDYAL